MLLFSVAAWWGIMILKNPIPFPMKSSSFLYLFIVLQNERPLLHEQECEGSGHHSQALQPDCLGSNEAWPWARGLHLSVPQFTASKRDEIILQIFVIKMKWANPLRRSFSVWHCVQLELLLSLLLFLSWHLRVGCPWIL